MFVLLSLSIILSSCGKSNDVVRSSQSELADSQLSKNFEAKMFDNPKSSGWRTKAKAVAESNEAKTFLNWLLTHIHIF